MKLLFKLENKLSTLKKLEQLLLPLKDEWGVTKKQFLEINLILDELCSNIIQYGENTPEQIITVELSLQKERLAIVVEDNGIPFDPTRVAKPDTGLSVEHRPIGGLGIHLVGQYSGNCTYQRVDNKNRLTIIKTL